MTRGVLLATLVLAGALAPVGIASAEIFPDNEARKAINELRIRADGVDSRLDRIEQLSNQTSRNQLDMAGQIDALRQDIARLRGTLEVMQKDLADSQKRQQDFYADIDSRLKKTEPQTVSIDGQDVAVEVDQIKAYNAAFDLYRNSQFAPAASAFTQFVSLYPQSPYAPLARLWLGNSLYASRDFKGAIAAQQALIKNFPDNAHVPDALLTIGNSQLELGDKAGARKSFREVTDKFASSNAAQSAKERLASIK
ncbi:tol-pal system protein YbgF [soil metagenome]